MDLKDVKTGELIEFYKKFDEFLKYLEKCKYRSCKNTNESYCAVKDAVKAGILDNGRYERYKTIFENLKKEWQKNHG